MRYASAGLGLLLVVGLAMADTACTFTPASSVGVRAAGHVLIEWQPGEEVADTYRVFGLDDNAATLLSEWNATENALQLPVPDGYPYYGVAGMKNDVQSPIVVTRILDSRAPCISIDIDVPPGVWITCLDHVAPLRIRLMMTLGNKLLA